MQSSVDRIRFILYFSQRDLAIIRAGDLLNLREDLGAFMGGQDGGDLMNVREGIAAFLGGGEEGMALPHRGGIVTYPMKPPLEEMTMQDFQALQAELRTIFDSIVAGDDRAPRYETVGRCMMSAPIKLMPIEARYALVTERVRRTPGEGTHLAVMGPTRDMILLTTLWLLNNESADSIIRCPECATVFYRVGRQQYCSSPCRNRAASRQWRSNEENRQKNRDKAHEAYKAKKTAAGSATVQRRPRQRKREPLPA